MLPGCPEATCVATPAWIVCAGWSAVTMRCWRSTWPTTPRWWCLRPRLAGAGPPDLAVPPMAAGSGAGVGAGGGGPARLGHRGRGVVEQASRLGLEAVCVQPLLVGRAREAEDFTRDKSDDKDALLIARLTTHLPCYLPERATAAWARLRHLGNRRVEQLALATAAQQRLRDLLECGWPAALEVARHPLDSSTWRAAMTVGRCDPARIRQLGFTRF